jgi:glucokinase
MTLDAGGTTLAFTAIQGTDEVVEPIVLPSPGDDLEQTLQAIIKGFREVRSALSKSSAISQAPVAISFSFPGPADYALGIIDDLENMPAFRGGVALGSMLEDEFGVPVFISNDGDLFAYGEAIAGLLPEINDLLEKKGSPKRYQNLFGATFGTGFGGGIVSRGQLFTGDNSAAGEINRSRNRLLPECSVEESISVRGVRRVYAREAELKLEDAPSPKEFFEIASGESGGGAVASSGAEARPGAAAHPAADDRPQGEVGRLNRTAALKAFEELAIVAGDALAGAVTLVDGLVVIGGGLAGAHSVFLPRLVEEMNRPFKRVSGPGLDRMEVRAFNLEDDAELAEFVAGGTREITVPHSEKKITYDPVKRIGVGVTRLGTTKAVAIGAYAFALARIDGG